MCRKSFSVKFLKANEIPHTRSELRCVIDIAKAKATTRGSTRAKLSERWKRASGWLEMNAEFSLWRERFQDKFSHGSMPPRLAHGKIIDQYHLHIRLLHA
jgi:hypothetical protein